MRKIHHQLTTKNPSVLIWEPREKWPDPRSLYQLTSISVKNTERNWRNNTQSGLQMKSWGMWAQSGLTWIKSKKNLIMKWQLKTRLAMTNSCLSLPMPLITSIMCSIFVDQEDRQMWTITRAIISLMNTIIKIEMKILHCRNPQLKKQPEIRIPSKKNSTTTAVSIYSSLSLKPSQCKITMMQTWTSLLSIKVQLAYHPAVSNKLALTSTTTLFSLH